MVMRMASEKSRTEVLGRIINQLEKLSNYEAQAGFWSGVHSPSGLPLAEIAIANNEGTDKIPSRPFMDEAGNASQLSVASKVKVAVADVVMCRKTAFQALKPIAEDQKEYIEAFILDWAGLGSMALNNANLTIALKGRDRPLVDTGTLSESVQTRVINKGAEE